MFDAGALCSCGATYTNGNAGEPYIRFAREDGEWEWP